MPRKTTKETTDDHKPAARKTTTTNTRNNPAPTKSPVKTPTRTSTRGSRGGRGRGGSVRPAPQIPQLAPETPVINGQWRRIDLHMHTPASHDYEQPETSYLDILRQAERRGLDIIAFTDHNTINGYRAMQRDIADLELLETLGRIRADELGRLSDYRRLLKKILVLPGFEVTCTFGFHVIGLFPLEKSLRDMEFILLQLRVPVHVLEQGLTEAGATSDVLTAYRLIHEAGGIVMAPHANSSSGVFMRGLNIGGQTRMAYTQDANLNAIELTDLAKGRRSMAMWFNGSKPEYGRKMHIFQGSDAHRLTNSPTSATRLGVGERTSEILLPELSFNALRELLLSQDFTRERVSERPLEVATDALLLARQKGNTSTQTFHAALPKKGDKFVAVLSDITAMANASGGDIYIGCDPQSAKGCAGLPDADIVSAELAEEIQKRIEPRLNIRIELQHSEETDVLHISIPRVENPPYVLDGHHFYVRTETETHMAGRDEIVALVRRLTEAETPTHKPAHAAAEHKPVQHQQRQPQQQSQQRAQQPQRESTREPSRDSSRGQPTQGRNPSQQQRGRQRDQQPRQQGNGQPQPQNVATVADAKPVETPAIEEVKIPLSEIQFEGTPRSGVEILSTDERDGIHYYTVRDLRNRSTVRNVTRKSARDLWLYALLQHANDIYDANTVPWQNDRAVLSRSVRAGKVRYDLALRDPAGKAHIYYGASDDAIDTRWKEMIQAAMPEEVVASEAPESNGMSQNAPENGVQEFLAQVAEEAIDDDSESNIPF